MLIPATTRQFAIPKPPSGPFLDKDQGRDLSGTVQGAGGIGGLLSATHNSSPVTQYFFTYDANGNVSDLIATNGTIAGHYEYGPYGNVLTSTGSESTSNVFRFSTKYWDDEVGLGYWGRRYYHPDEGRWVSRDPVGETGGDHLYAFVRNHTVDSYDINGLQEPPAKLTETSRGAKSCGIVIWMTHADNVWIDPNTTSFVFPQNSGCRRAAFVSCK